MVPLCDNKAIGSSAQEVGPAANSVEVLGSANGKFFGRAAIPGDACPGSDDSIHHGCCPKTKLGKYGIISVVRVPHCQHIESMAPVSVAYLEKTTVISIVLWGLLGPAHLRQVRNSLTWFSHGSGAILAPEPLGRVPFSTTKVFETLFSLN